MPESLFLFARSCNIRARGIAEKKLAAGATGCAEGVRAASARLDRLTLSKCHVARRRLGGGSRRSDTRGLPCMKLAEVALKHFTGLIARQFGNYDNF